MGAALAVLCGLILWAAPIGEKYANASYDYLFLFPSRVVTNKIVLVLMDETAHQHYDKSRDLGGWDREIHADFLGRLAGDACPLVVFDIFFLKPGVPETDRRLADAIKRAPCVVLAAKRGRTNDSGIEATFAERPIELFLTAAKTNWGVACFDQAPGDQDALFTVRQHWPFPSPDGFPSLPWTAAVLSGANLDDAPRERWMRYYGNLLTQSSLSYNEATNRYKNYFHDKIVFVGNKPETTLLDSEPDKFRTPYTHWKGKPSCGVEILATEYLNLRNGDWLRRPAWPVEVLVFTLTGMLLGGGLCQFRRLPAFRIACGAALALTLGGGALSYYTNFWVPWLVVVGGQVPCALAWAMLPARVPFQTRTSPTETIVLTFPDEKPPDAPEYELFDKPFGAGGFGKVWLARNAIGQWQALKAVYQAKFGDNTVPYEAEFKGLQKYKPVSEKHPGLLRIDFVSRKKEAGYFYYVMELGDSRTPGWEQNPTTYKPKDLDSVRKQADGRRLPFAECVRIGAILADALDFLHRQGLTHRDIKPSNVIFVNGRPKLADVGLVTDIRPPEIIHTLVGTPGYMPPPPERPGTAQADIYALGMLLYVISTGCDPDLFPALSTTLMERSGHADFIRLNAVILKACQPDCAQRYQTTSELLRALQELQQVVS